MRRIDKIVEVTVATLIVVSIVGLLATIVYSEYLKFRDKRNQSYMFPVVTNAVTSSDVILKKTVLDLSHVRGIQGAVAEMVKIDGHEYILLGNNLTHHAGCDNISCRIR